MSRNAMPDDRELFTGRKAAEMIGVKERSLRAMARRLFPDDSPGQGKVWKLTRAMIEEIRRHMRSAQPRNQR